MRQGIHYRWSKDFTHDPAHTTLDRIDRIILQLNLATRSINLMIKKVL